MNILICHNFYNLPGGEDQVFQDETNLLRSHGHEVLQYTIHNNDIKKSNLFIVAVNTIFNKKIYYDLKHFLMTNKPDIVQIHNFFPLLSPSIYFAIKKSGIPIVQTLHNYRLLCLNAYLFRNGSTCNKCNLRKFKWPGIYYKCYRNNRLASLVVAIMLFVHNLINTWDKVDRFIALSNFSKAKFIEAGIPASKIIVKSNMVSDIPFEPKNPGNYVLFLGRLTEEKGIFTLIKAINQVESASLKMVGSGLLENELLALVKEEKRKSIEYLGQINHKEAQNIVKNAFIIVYPSLLYENFGLSIIEAFANGIPVIASNHGAIAELVKNGVTGLLFEPGNSFELAQKIRWAYENPNEISLFGLNARKEFLEKYTPEISYRNLSDIYKELMHS